MDSKEFIEKVNSLGVNFGPATFENSKGNLLIAPPIFIVHFELDNIKNEIKNEDNSLFKINNHLNSMISSLLLYFENRLKFMKIKNKFKGDRHSVRGLCKIYKKEGINIYELVNQNDFDLLIDIDQVRGERQHTTSRYTQTFKVGTLIINSKQDLLNLVNTVESIIWNIEEKLDKITKLFNFDIKIENNFINVDIDCLNTAFNFKENKLVPIDKDKNQIKYIGFSFNTSK